MEPWATERKLSAIADRFYREKRRIEASLLKEDTTRLESLRADYRQLADYHHTRFNLLGLYHYYVI